MNPDLKELLQRKAERILFALLRIVTALKKHNSLNKPEFWKSAMNVVNLCSALIPTIAVIVPEAQAFIDTGFLVKLYSALAALNVYFTTTTTVKIGV